MSAYQVPRAAFPLFPILYIALIIGKFTGFVHMGWFAVVSAIIWMPIVLCLAWVAIIALFGLIAIAFVAAFSRGD